MPYRIAEPSSDDDSNDEMVEENKFTLVDDDSEVDSNAEPVAPESDPNSQRKSYDVKATEGRFNEEYAYQNTRRKRLE